MFCQSHSIKHPHLPSNHKKQVRGDLLTGKKLLRCAVYTLLSAAFFTLPPQAGKAAVKTCSNQLSAGIPERISDAPSGTSVMQALRNVSGQRRDDAVTEQVLSGNVPEFLRQLAPVEIPGVLATGERVLVTICVTPEYLAVGNDDDFVRVPMGLAAAAMVATELGFFLPTPKMVDEIYKRAQIRLTPRPMKPTAQMVSTDYLMRHSLMLDEQRNSEKPSPAALTAGQKKDIVITNRLRSKPGRVAIYGWHRPNGRPIQPLSTVHGAEYADYSHGVRLVSQTAFVNGRPMDLSDLMAHQELAGVVSAEGPIIDVRSLMASKF